MRLRFQIALLTAMRIIIQSPTRMVYPFLAVFSRGLGVNIGAITIAITLRSAAGMLVPLLTQVADRYGRKSIMIIGTILFTIANLLMLFVPNYTGFFIMLVLSELGVCLFLAASHAYLGDEIAYERRGLAISLFESGWAATFFLVVPVLGFLIERYGWRAPFPVLAAAGVIVLALLLTNLIPARGKQAEAAQLLGGNKKGLLKKVLTNPSALAALAMSFFITNGVNQVSVVFGVWLEDSFLMSAVTLGVVSAVIGVAELGGELFSGVASDRFGKQKAIGAGLLAGSLCAAALGLLNSNQTIAVIGLTLFFVTFEIALVSSIPLLTEIMPSARATLIGANSAAVNLGLMTGAILAPLFYQQGFWLNGLMTCISFLLAFAAMRQIRLGT